MRKVGIALEGFNSVSKSLVDFIENNKNKIIESLGYEIYIKEIKNNREDILNDESISMVIDDRESSEVFNKEDFYGKEESLLKGEINEIYCVLNEYTNIFLEKLEKEKIGFKEGINLLNYDEKKLIDIEGIDTGIKFSKLASSIFDKNINFEDIYIEDITHINYMDIEYAKKIKRKIKFLAMGKEVNSKIELRIHPTMIKKEGCFGTLNDNLNKIVLKGPHFKEIIVYGKERDGLYIEKLLKDIDFLFRSKEESGEFKSENKIRDIRGVYSKYYIRIRGAEEALDNIIDIFNDNDVSIEFESKKENKDNFIILTTSLSRESQIINAIDDIYELKNVKKIENIIRIEDI